MCLSKIGAFVDELALERLEPEEFNLDGGLLKANTIRQVARIARRLRDRGAELLHCHDFYSALIGSLAARAAGIPYIVSRRDMGIDRSFAKRHILAFATRAAPQVVCNAEAVRRLIVAEGVDPSRITVIPNGLDLIAFDARAARPLADDARAELGEHPLIVLVGNMQLALKGHAMFLDAASEIARWHPTVRFALIGDGRLRQSLEEKAHTLGIRHRVWFGGWRTDVESILAHATIAVSASESEGLSNAIIESMAAALPVVATRVGGTPELVTDKTGFLVESSDARTLARRVNQLLASPELARQLGAGGRLRVERDYSTARLEERLQTLYHAVLGTTLPHGYSH